MKHTDDHDDFGGLRRDLKQLSRRQLLGLFGGVGATALLAGCSSSGGDDTGTDPDAADGTCSRIPEETGGPFPGDGTNGANALALAGVVRSDIRTSFAGPTAVATGSVLTMTFAIIDASTCQPLAGHAVYVWHCDANGKYSMYEAPVEGENYLRGVQITDASGQVTFTTVFPACYPGRWPHMHFEVFASAAAATNGDAAISTSQLALPEAACNEVYATAGYESSVTELAKVSLASDGVFRDDGAGQQLATVVPTADGHAATITVAVAG